MKLSIKRLHLLETLRMVQPAVNGKSTLPVLACFHLAAGDGLLRVSATSLDMGIMANAPALIDEPGAICTPAKMLLDLLATATDDTIKLEVDGYKLRMMWGKSKNHLQTMPAEEFPPMPAFLYEGQEIAGQAFATAIKQVAFSASYDEARPVLQGVQIAKGKWVTTDGFRLSITRLEALDFMGLIPAPALTAAARLARDGAVTIRLDNGRVIITGAGWQLTSNQINGTFPDYNAILPKKKNTTVTLSGKALKPVIAQVKAVGGEITKLEFTDTGAVVSGHSEDGGDTSTEIDALVNGPPVAIAFNTEYLAQAVNALGEAITLDLIDGKSPCTMHGDDPNFTHVIMPMHLG